MYRPIFIGFPTLEERGVLKYGNQEYPFFLYGGSSGSIQGFEYRYVIHYGGWMNKMSVSVPQILSE